MLYNKLFDWQKLIIDKRTILFLRSSLIDKFLKKYYNIIIENK